MKNKTTTLNRIKIENIIWIIYIFIIGFNLYSNKLEKEYTLTGNKISKEKFKKINKTVLTIILIIYIYFVYISYQDLISSNKKEKKYEYLAFISSILFLIGGTISLYIASNSKDGDEEIAII